VGKIEKIGKVYFRNGFNNLTSILQILVAPHLGATAVWMMSKRIRPASQGLRLLGCSSCSSVLASLGEVVPV